MRTLLVCALLVPAVALGKPVLLRTDKTATEKTGAKPSSPSVEKAPAAEKAKANAKAPAKAVEAPAKP